MNGGQEALTGFAAQVTVAVLDSFAANWTEVTVEPTSETDEYEKVDILWKFTNGDIEFVQVKRSKNAFGPGKIEEWVKEVRDSMPAARKRLVLVGVPSAGGMSCVSTFEGVYVDIVPGQFEVLLDACAHRVRKHLEAVQIFSTAETSEAAARALVGQLLLHAKDGRTWRRVEIETIIAVAGRAGAVAQGGAGGSYGRGGEGGDPGTGGGGGGAYWGPGGDGGAAGLHGGGGGGGGAAGEHSGGSGGKGGKGMGAGGGGGGAGAPLLPAFLWAQQRTGVSVEKLMELAGVRPGDPRLLEGARGGDGGDGGPDGAGGGKGAGGAGPPVHLTVTLANTSSLMVDFRDESFGDGSDGAAIFDGTAVPDGSRLVSPNSYVLCRDVSYTSATIDAGIVLKPEGHTIRACERLTVDGIISANGADASGPDEVASAGGVIVLESPILTTNGKLEANGGAGFSPPKLKL